MSNGFQPSLQLSMASEPQEHHLLELTLLSTLDTAACPEGRLKKDRSGGSPFTSLLSVGKSHVFPLPCLLTHCVMRLMCMRLMSPSCDILFWPLLIFEDIAENFDKTVSTSSQLQNI